MRLRVRYTKTGKVRFTSHRDVVRMWERALRRSGLPVAWSEGFSPRPLLSFGHALPTGAESFAEYLDISLVPGARYPGDARVAPAAGAGPDEAGPDEAGPDEAGPDGAGPDEAGPDEAGPDEAGPDGAGPDEAGPDGAGPHEVASEELGGHLARILSELLPDGVDVHAIAPLPSGSWSLQQEVSSCSWNLEVFGLAAEELASRVERLLAAPTALVERERKGRTALDDLRPAVLALAVAAHADDEPGEPAHPERSWLEAELATRPRGVRPRELLAVLGPGVKLSRACRMHQWIERDGTRVEPLVVHGREAGAVAAHAEGRAP